MHREIEPYQLVSIERHLKIKRLTTGNLQASLELSTWCLSRCPADGGTRARREQLRRHSRNANDLVRDAGSRPGIGTYDKLDRKAQPRNVSLLEIWRRAFFDRSQLVVAEFEDLGFVWIGEEAALLSGCGSDPGMQFIRDVGLPVSGHPVAAHEDLRAEDVARRVRLTAILPRPADLVSFVEIGVRLNMVLERLSMVNARKYCGRRYRLHAEHPKWSYLQWYRERKRTGKDCPGWTAWCGVLSASAIVSDARDRLTRATQPLSKKRPRPSERSSRW